MSEHTIVKNLPLLALRGMVVYPHQTVHFDIGRIKSAMALEYAMKNNQELVLVPQKNLMDDDPKLSQLYSVGTVVKIKQILKSQNENIRVLVTGLYRCKIISLSSFEPFLQGDIVQAEEMAVKESLRTRALCREANNLYSDYLEIVERPNQTVQLQIMTSKDCGFVADCIGQYSGIDYPDKAKLLCQLNPLRRLEQCIQFLQEEFQMLQLENSIQEKTRVNIDQDQRDYFLREQMKVIQEELGGGESVSEFSEYEKKIRGLKLEKSSEEKLLKELNKIKKQPFGSSEAAVLRNYLDTVLELPWNSKTKERLDIQGARKILDRDHFGLEKVKERILEVLAVKKMTEQMPSQIICLVGPPGVGKTSIAYSIATSLNRKLARISLGGVHDEADIRGHRKTYVGAMPGRIMTALTQAGSKNPILLLDEVDKMGSDYRGDPSAALLEVLDSEQNRSYRDHFVEVPFDLSEVMFIATANTLDTVPRPLLDRMEIIEIGSYTDEEKLMIAKNHLIPKQMKKHGLVKAKLKITDDAIREIIRCYTRESGVRTLERHIAQICRKVDLKLLSDESVKRIHVSQFDLETYLGVRKFQADPLPSEDPVGLVTGLAWTSVGGETLEVEVGIMDGVGKLILTGNLGDVMKESAQAAMSYIRANAGLLGIEQDFYKTKDIHVHFPEGAVPKDGPSAGITVCTALVSALTGTAVRRDVAMTGEISLRGRVLPIGGLKEKTMAALRHGISTVIIPKENERDLQDIDQTVRNALQFICAESVDTVLKAALVPKMDSLTAIIRDIPTERRIKSRNPEIRQ